MARGRGVAYLFVRTPTTQRNLQRVTASADQRVQVQAEATGRSVIHADLGESVTRADGRVVRARIERAAAGDRVDAPNGEVTVRHLETATALIDVVGDSPTSSTAATQKIGASIEVRLLVDPTTLSVGDDMPFRAYVDGDKAPGG